MKKKSGWGNMLLAFGVTLVATGCSGSVSTTAGAAGAAGAAGNGDAAAAAPHAEPTAGSSDSGVQYCPAVAVMTSAVIRADFPFSAASSDGIALRVCRNDECHSGVLANGSIVVAEYDPYVWVTLEPVTGSTGLQLLWSQSPDPNDYTRVDRYRMSSRTPGNATDVPVFDTQVTYSKQMYSEPEYANCGSWGEAVVDLRAAP